MNTYMLASCILCDTPKELEVHEIVEVTMLITNVGFVFQFVILL